MREIKFRGWSKSIKKMTYFGDGTGLITSSVLSDGETWGAFYKAQGDVYLTGYQSFMQYAGLKDKNSKDVFEGDVIQPIGFEGLHYVVEFLNSAFMAKKIGCVSAWERGPRILGDMIEFEVIGNIHDNPELLEGE